MKLTIAIIGAGVVGSTTAYTLLLQNISSKIILIDINEIKCKGEVTDLSDTYHELNDSEIVMGTLSQAGQADIAIITAGISQKPGQDRLSLLETNCQIVQSIIKGMQPLQQHLIIILITNPVDILTYVAQTIAKLPKHQIFGSGTFLDSQRLIQLISKKINIKPQKIGLTILGEHGDNQCVAWSTATIAGSPLLNFPSVSNDDLEQLAKLSAHKAYDIIACKGATAFGISSSVSYYCKNIIKNSKKIIPVSCYLDQYGVCMSIPAMIGSQGIEKIVMPKLNDSEKKCLEKSAQLLKKYIKKIV